MSFAQTSAIHQVADVLEPMVTHVVIDAVAAGVRVAFEPTPANKNARLRNLFTATHGRADGSLEQVAQMLMASAQSSHTKGGARFTQESYLSLIEGLRALGLETDDYRDFGRRHLNFDPRPILSREATEGAVPRRQAPPNSAPQELMLQHLSSPAPPTDPTTRAAPDAGRVFVIFGRNHRAKKELGIFLQSIGLRVLNFEEVRASLGGTPTVGDIISEAMHRALAVIAIFTPDEFAHLRPEAEFASGGDAKEPDLVSRWQARPNVIFEAGMAFGIDRKRLIPVVFGDVRLFTDVGGIHLLRPTKDPRGDRKVLRDTLKSLGCTVNDSDDWMDHGDFEICAPPAIPVTSPFVKA